MKTYFWGHVLFRRLFSPRSDQWARTHRQELFQENTFLRTSDDVGNVFITRHVSGDCYLERRFPQHLISTTSPVVKNFLRTHLYIHAHFTILQIKAHLSILLIIIHY